MSTATATIHGDALLIAENDRDAWLARRKQSIGSSDAAAVLGASQFATPIDAWQEKIGIAKDREDSEPMLWGRLLEPVLAAEYGRRTGMPFTGSQLFFVHRDRPWMTATLDGLRADGRIVELKTASAWAREWGDENGDNVPEPYLVQVHHQMAVTGAVIADVAVLIGGQRFKIYTVERNEDLIEFLMTTEERFWNCVQRRIPPTWGRLDAASLAVIYPDCAGSVELEDGATEFVRRYQRFDAAVKRFEELKEDSKAKVLERMGSHQFGRLADGRLIKRFREEVKESEISYTRKAYTKTYFKILKGDSR